jgi:hypothetical protein
MVTDLFVNRYPLKQLSVLTVKIHWVPFFKAQYRLSGTLLNCISDCLKHYYFGVVFTVLFDWFVCLFVHFWLFSWSFLVVIFFFRFFVGWFLVFLLLCIFWALFFGLDGFYFFRVFLFEVFSDRFGFGWKFLDFFLRERLLLFRIILLIVLQPFFTLNSDFVLHFVKYW